MYTRDYIRYILANTSLHDEISARIATLQHSLVADFDELYYPAAKQLSDARIQSSRQSDLLQELERTYIEISLYIEAHRASINDYMATLNDIDRIMACYYALSDPYRSCIRLSIIERQKTEAVASELKLSRPTISSHIQSGLDAIAQLADSELTDGEIRRLHLASITSNKIHTNSEQLSIFDFIEDEGGT